MALYGAIGRQTLSLLPLGGAESSWCPCRSLYEALYAKLTGRQLRSDQRPADGSPRGAVPADLPERAHSSKLQSVLQSLSSWTVSPRT